MEIEDDESLEMGLRELEGFDLCQLKDDETLWIMESEFPETTIGREGAVLVAEITEGTAFG